VQVLSLSICLIQQIVSWMCSSLSAHVQMYTTQGTTTGTHTAMRDFRFSQRRWRRWWRSVLALLVRGVSTDRSASIFTAVLTCPATQPQTPEDSSLHSLLTQNCFYTKIRKFLLKTDKQQRTS